MIVDKTVACKYNSNIMYFPMGEKTVLWFSDLNKYLVAKPPVDEVIQQIYSGKGNDELISFCCKQFEMEQLQAEIIISDIKNYLNENLSKDQHKLEGQDLKKFATTSKLSKKYYRINNQVFLAKFETERSKDLIHPKFANFEILQESVIDYQFIVYNSDNRFTLKIDDRNIGTWSEDDGHFLGGKFSMQVIQKIYGKEENEWMGVFHAAGVSDGENCIMFPGGSGNGKSTLSAILLANGLDILSDDFLPVERSHSLVCRFPAAISVKRQSYNLLMPHFPELEQKEEHFNPALNKTFRYLPLPKTDLLSVPCKAFVFVKYKKDAGFNLEELPKDEAFEQLIPDSWISPKTENAQRFMNWFGNMPCYRLVYSDNNRMVETIKSLLADE